MENNFLRGPLIKSLILLVIFFLLIYFTSTSSEGTVWNSLAIIFKGVFRVAQLGVGLVLALAFCLIVLSGIFLGAVAVVSKDSAAKMYEHLKQMAANTFQFVQGRVGKDQSNSYEELKAEILAFFSNTLTEIKKNQAEYYLQFKSISERLRQLESVGLESSELKQLADLDQEFVVAKENIQAVQAGLQEVQVNCQNIEQQLKGITPEAIQGDFPQRLHELEKAILNREETNSIKQQLELLQIEVDSLKAQATSVKEEVIPSEKKSSEKVLPDDKKSVTINHRINSYLPNQKECDRLAELVGQTLDKDMTYAQVVEFLTENLSKETAFIVGSHPSLLKDYIRQWRKVTD